MLRGFLLTASFAVLCLLISLLTSLPAVARSESATDRLAGAYYLQHAAFAGTLSLDGQPKCDPSHSSGCVDEACRHVSCSFQDDVLAYARACAGNYGPSCVHTACSKVECNNKQDLLDVINSCRGNDSNTCLTIACEHVSCSFKKDVLDFVNACQNVDGGCVANVCRQMACSFKDDLLKVIHSCGGRP